MGALSGFSGVEQRRPGWATHPPKLFIAFILLVLVLGFSFCLCVCVLCKCVPSEETKGMSGPLALKLQVVVSHPTWVLGTKLRSSGEQPVLTAEPSLQPWCDFQTHLT